MIAKQMFKDLINKQFKISGLLVHELPSKVHSPMLQGA
jgi:hypothetical protein